MSGLIFVSFIQMIEENFGLEILQTIIEKGKLKSEGVYVRGDSYDKKEFFILLNALSSEINMSKRDILKMYGESLSDYLNDTYPEFFEGKNLKSVLLNLNNVVTKDLKLIYRDIYLPVVNINEDGTKKVVIEFVCSAGREDVLEGFIRGVGRLYSESFYLNKSINQVNQKMQCQIEINLT